MKRINRRTKGQYVMFAILWAVALCMTLAFSAVFATVMAMTVDIYGATPEYVTAVFQLSMIVAIPGLVIAWYFAQDEAFNS